MGTEGKGKDVSGWYVKEKLSPEEEAARLAEIDAWYEKRHTMNYRTVPLEIPGKMLAALGKLSIERKIEFSVFIEGILDEYLQKQGIQIDTRAP
jgi:hypothetical protein